MEWWLILIIILAILLGVFFPLYFLKLYIRRAKYTKDTKIPGKVVIVTGANTGIGKETAIDLAKRGAKVYIACRDIKRGEEAQREIKEASQSDNVHFLQLDLASLDSVREFSEKFHEHESQLHILINNAGIMMCPKSFTKDGFEMQIGVNHLGPFLLTHLLLDLIKAAAPSRIINVSSSGHTFSDIIKDDFMSEKSYSKIRAYGQSKLANILTCHELSKRLVGLGITANSLHPGAVRTDLQRHINGTLNAVSFAIFGPFFKTPWEGAQTTIRLAVDPELEKVTAKYFVNCKEAKTSIHANNDDTSEWLYNKSLELVNL